MTSEKTTPAKRRPGRPRKKPAARAAKPAEPVDKISRNDQGRAVRVDRAVDQLTIEPHSVRFRIAVLKRAWLVLLPALGALFAIGSYGLVDPLIGVVAVVLSVLAVPVIFVLSWRDQFMPVMKLELNQRGDGYQLRVFDAKRGDYGSDGRLQIFGRIGYGVDGLENADKPLSVFDQPAEYETTAPESLRYMCDHTPSREKYRRLAKRLASDIIQWSAITLLIGILAGLTYLIGNRNY